MTRVTGIVFAALLLAATAFASPASAGPYEPAGCGDGYPLGFGFGWTSKYYAMGRCPGFQQCRPWNPLFAVPIHSSVGQTGPRRILLWPPGIGSPLYNNTPMLYPYPRDSRPCPGVVCPY
jgi:hypothetical protein